MALNNYERMAHASIRGSGLRIHGSQQLFYSQLSDCALACSAAADCAEPLCTITMHGPSTAHSRSLVRRAA